MEDWSLASSPLTMSIRNWRVPWENTAHIPPVEVWEVDHCSLLEPLVIEHDWLLVSKTSSKSSGNEECEVGIRNPASDVEVLNRKFSDDSET